MSHQVLYRSRSILPQQPQAWVTQKFLDQLCQENFFQPILFWAKSFCAVIVFVLLSADNDQYCFVASRTHLISSKMNGHFGLNCLHPASFERKFLVLRVGGWGGWSKKRMKRHMSWGLVSWKMLRGNSAPLFRQERKTGSSGVQKRELQLLFHKNTRHVDGTGTLDAKWTGSKVEVVTLLVSLLWAPFHFSD